MRVGKNFLALLAGRGGEDPDRDLFRKEAPGGAAAGLREMEGERP